MQTSDRPALRDPVPVHAALSSHDRVFDAVEATDCKTFCRAERRPTSPGQAGVAYAGVATVV
jgi:hypothetical protein